MTFTSLSAVWVDYNRPSAQVNGKEVWVASCDSVEATALQVGELVLAVTEVPGEGFVARVAEAPVARGRRLDPHTGQAAQAYRLLVSPVDLAPLVEVKK